MLPFIHLGFFDLPTFGLFLWLGGCAAAWVMHRNFVRNGVKQDAITVVVTVTIAGVIGAKAWHELQDPHQLAISIRQIFVPGWSRPLAVFTSFISWFRAGFAWYGGLAAGIAVLLYHGWVKFEGKRVGPLRMLDLATAAAAVGYAIGRVGCLTSGDGDYGINTKLPWGVHIRSDALDPPIPNPPGLLVQPTPIYELLFGLALGWYMWVRGRKQLPIGQLTGEYLILSGVGRFLVEFVRRNPRIYWGMTNAQMASLGSCLVGAVLIAWVRARRSAGTAAA